MTEETSNEATNEPSTRVPRRRWIAILPVVIAVLLGGVFAKRLADVKDGLDPTVLQSVLLNTPVPDLDLPPLPGRDRVADGIKTEHLKGEVSLVNIWGSWCIACLAEHPLLMAIQGQSDVPIHGIAWRDDPQASLKWLGRHGDPYSRIGQDPISEAAIAFGVTGAPETFVVDANGIIRYKHTGPISPDDWSNTIQPLIEQLRQ
ncbi:MAG: DsbE family thiol:disulfide interchange protein [Rhodospirillaceae bacterium]|jgi:cytochrome c biogenesis protein CcmG, thiol:disulfide interchange protein DsbE